MEQEKGSGRFVEKMTDRERLEWLFENAVIYIYIGEEENARDLKSRADIDAAVVAQEEDLS